MTRRLAFVLALALVAAACGGLPDAGSSGDTATSQAAGTPETTASTEAAGGSATGPGTTDPTGTVAPPVSGFDGPPAPSDAVPNAAGADILLSQEVLPVYLIFWAEW